MKFSILIALFLIFTTLKLTGHIEWSWWIVSMPFVLQIWIFGMYLTLQEMIKERGLSQRDKEQFAIIAHLFAWVPSIFYVILVIWLAG